METFQEMFQEMLEKVSFSYWPMCSTTTYQPLPGILLALVVVFLVLRLQLLRNFFLVLAILHGLLGLCGSAGVVSHLARTVTVKAVITIRIL